MTAAVPLAAAGLDGTSSAIVAAIVGEHLPQATVWVFGSLARGTHRLQSDLDIAVDAGAPLSIGAIAALREAVDASELPWRADVGKLRFADERIARDLARDGVAIVAAGRAAGAHPPR